MSNDLTPSATSIYNHLAKGPATSLALSEALDLSKNTVRAALAQLTDAGLVTQEGVEHTGKRGRPAYIFKRVSKSRGA